MARDRRFIERTRDAWDNAAEKFNDTKERTRDTIKENPFTSVLIAAAVGAVVGVATAETIRAIRRRRRE